MNTDPSTSKPSSTPLPSTTTSQPPQPPKGGPIKPDGGKPSTPAPEAD